MTAPQTTLHKIVRTAITLIVVIIAAGVLHQFYVYYTYAPQTRDGKIRADVVPLASDVSGWVESVHVRDNQKIRKGDLLFTINTSRMENALAQAKATLNGTKITLETASRDLQRYNELHNAVSQQERDTKEDAVKKAKANLEKAQADLQLAELNLERSSVYSPVNGIVTNFSLRTGAYATAGQPLMAIVDSSSFYVAGYFEETKLRNIHIGDTATIYVLGEKSPLAGHVVGFAAGIEDRETSTASGNLLANVNPTFSWIRLSQRIPVRIELDNPPENIALIAGRTATVNLNDAGFDWGF